MELHSKIIKTINNQEEYYQYVDLSDAEDILGELMELAIYTYNLS